MSMTGVARARRSFAGLICCSWARIFSCSALSRRPEDWQPTDAMMETHARHSLATITLFAETVLRSEFTEVLIKMRKFVKTLPQSASIRDELHCQDHFGHCATEDGEHESRNHHCARLRLP